MFRQGRAFVPDDDRPQSARVVVISYAFWQTVLGGDRGTIGESLTLNGVPRTVVGIMPAAFDFPHGASIWAPLVPEIASIRMGEFQALEAQGFRILYVFTYSRLLSPRRALVRPGHGLCVPSCVAGLS